MLVSLVLALVAAPIQDGPIVAPKTFDELKALVAGAGYPATTVDGERSALRIGRGEDAAVVAPYNGLAAFNARAQIATPREVDPAELAAPARPGTRGLAFAARARVGRTVDVSQSFSFRTPSTREALKAWLDGFFDQADAVAKRVGGKAPAVPRADWTGFRFDEATVLRGFDSESLDRLAQAWGWADPDPKRRGFQVNGTPLWVGGKRVWVRPRRTGPILSPSAVEMVARDPEDKGVPVGTVSGTFEGRPVTMPAYGLREHGDDVFEDGTRYRVKAREALDFASGMTLGEFRRRVEAFAKSA